MDIYQFRWFRWPTIYLYFFSWLCLSATVPIDKLLRGAKKPRVGVWVDEFTTCVCVASVNVDKDEKKKTMRELRYVHIVSIGALENAVCRVTGNIGACFFLPDPSHRPPQLGFRLVFCGGESAISLSLDQFAAKKISISNNNWVAVLPDSKLGVRQQWTRATSPNWSGWPILTHFGFPSEWQSWSLRNHVIFGHVTFFFVVDNFSKVPEMEKLCD